MDEIFEEICRKQDEKAARIRKQEEETAQKMKQQDKDVEKFLGKCKDLLSRIEASVGGTGNRFSIRPSQSQYRPGNVPFWIEIQSKIDKITYRTEVIVYCLALKLPDGRKVLYSCSDNVFTDDKGNAVTEGSIIKEMFGI